MSSARTDDRDAATTAEPLAALFAAVGDHTRLSLLRFLMREEHCVTQCSEHINLTHSAASKQLNALAAVGLLTVRPQSRRRYYHVTDPESLTTILDEAESIMARSTQYSLPPPGRRR